MRSCWEHRFARGPQEDPRYFQLRFSGRCKNFLLVLQSCSFAILQRDAPRHRHADGDAPRRFAQEQARSDKISKIFNGAAS